MKVIEESGNKSMPYIVKFYCDKCGNLIETYDYKKPNMARDKDISSIFKISVGVESRTYKFADHLCYNCKEKTIKNIYEYINKFDDIKEIDE